MKKILLCLSAGICLFFSAGCGKDGVERTAPPPAPAEESRQAADRSVETEQATPAAEPATPAIKRFTLNYAAGANGAVEGERSQTVDPGGEGSAVVAVPAIGSHFVGWSDGSTANPRTDIAVSADLSVTAIFAINRYTLAYAAGENGSVEGPTAQTVGHDGSGRAVKAVPAAGYHFESWSDGSTANPRIDGNVTADLAVKARFALNRYTLTYAAGKNGSIEGASPQVVDHGADGSAVTGVPGKEHHFVSWSDGVTTATRTDTNVTGDIAVSAQFAVDTYTVGGRVSGLVAGTRIVLQNNGGDDLTVTADGPFVFATAHPAGRPYAVKVTAQPTAPNQTCSVTGGAGAVPGANVTGIAVDCVLNTYTVGGTVSGLPDGSRVVLQNNKGDDLAVSANETFTFARALNDSSTYEVTIHGQELRPKWFCILENGAGRVAGRDVTDVDIACFPKAELQAKGGDRKIDLKWNSEDFSGATFRLCRAQEEISPAGFGRCTQLRGGVLEEKVSSPQAVSRLTNDRTYWLQLEVMHPGGRRTFSDVVRATPFGGLNDTGIDWCADNSGNRLAGGARTEKAAGCQAVAATHPGQDAHFGRDAGARSRKLAKSGAGSAGFDFTKVCMSGEAAGEGKCPPNPAAGSGANNWACTLDNVTGLLWEVKTTSGLRGQDHTYSWHTPFETVHGGAPGVQNGGSCQGSACDTNAYMQAVNAQRLCGASDWRLPTRRELLSIVDNGRYKPAIDTGYFPNTPAAYYWSSSPYAEQADLAWQIYFQYGEAYANSKSQGARVRLVRSAD